MVLQFCGVASRDKEFVFRVEATIGMVVPGDAKLSELGQASLDVLLLFSRGSSPRFAIMMVTLDWQL